MHSIENQRIAILATDGFELSELQQPLESLKSRGAEVDIVSPDKEEIQAWDQGEWSDSFEVDRQLSDISHNDYDALVLPGGVINPDKLRRHSQAVEFVKNCHNDGIPVAAICHAGWMLIEADIIKNKRATSYHSIQTDMKNAGAKWENTEVVVDNGIITSRSPTDLDAFIAKIVEEVKDKESMPTV